MHFSSLLIGGTQFKYYSDLIGVLETHLKEGVSLKAQVDEDIILLAVKRLKRLRLSAGTSFSIAVIFPVLCAVLPAISTYFFPTSYLALLVTGISAAWGLKAPMQRAKHHSTSKSSHTSTNTVN